MDFRLKVFVSVARHLSFTKAAKELHISQPAITKHIKELESAYKVLLFERSGGKIALTSQGSIFLRHANEILDRYQVLSDEMELVTGQFSGKLRIGASSTIAQYLVPQLLANFILRFPKVKVSLLTGNSEQMENALAAHKIDIALVEGSRRRSNLNCSELAKDKLVLVTSVKNNTADCIDIDEIVKLPLVLGEAGSGTLEVIENTLAGKGIKLQDLNILLHMSTTEGIKNFIKTTQDSYAIMPVISVLDELKNNELKVISTNGTEILEEFVFVTLDGDINESIRRFISFAVKWYSINF